MRGGGYDRFRGRGPGGNRSRSRSPPRGGNGGGGGDAPPRQHRPSGEWERYDDPAPPKERKATQAIEPMDSYKVFMMRQDENSTPETYQQRYEEYKKKYVQRLMRAFFEDHKKEEWLQERYSPAIRHRLEVQKRSKKITEAKNFGERVRNGTAKICLDENADLPNKDFDNDMEDSARILYIRRIPCACPVTSLSESILGESIKKAVCLDVLHRCVGSSIVPRANEWLLHALMLLLCRICREETFSRSICRTQSRRARSTLTAPRTSCTTPPRPLRRRSPRSTTRSSRTLTRSLRSDFRCDSLCGNWFSEAITVSTNVEPCDDDNVCRSRNTVRARR